jgi:hypothetical protein
MEHDPGVLEYYDQSPSIPLAYHAANGGRLSVMHTPDCCSSAKTLRGARECETSEYCQKLTMTRSFPSDSMLVAAMDSCPCR